MLLPKQAVDRVCLQLERMDLLRERASRSDQRWLKAIDTVTAQLDPLARQLLTLYFAQGRTGLEVMEALCIERTTFYTWREQVVTRVALAAVELGVLQVYFGD